MIANGIGRSLKVVASVALGVGVAACGEGGPGMKVTGSVLQGIGGGGGMGGKGGQAGGLPTLFTTQTGEDNHIVENDQANYGTLDRVSVRGDGTGTAAQMVGLVVWLMPTVPNGCVVQNAQITVRVRSTSNQSFNLYEAKRPWAAGSSNWTLASDASNPWEIPGAKGATDRGPAFLSFAPSSLGFLNLPLGSAGNAIVQSWVNDPVHAKGLVLWHETHSDGFTISSFNDPTPSFRPKLAFTCQ